MQEATFEKERSCVGNGYTFVAGVDEAGRGPLAGPVVACAAVLKNQESGIKNQEEKEWSLVRDSKTLSEKQREAAFDFVHEKFHVGIGIIHAETIDRVNILEATFLAMREAVGELQRAYKNENKKRIIPAKAGIQISETSLDPRVKPEDDKEERMIVLVDGNMTIPNLSLDQEAVVGGDSLVRSIAAASIVAKVTRDRMMLEYDAKYPQYGFAKHKGYGTKIHMDALRKYGASPLHRMSFKPVFYSVPENVNRNLLSRKK